MGFVFSRLVSGTWILVGFIFSQFVSRYEVEVTIVPIKQLESNKAV